MEKDKAQQTYRDILKWGDKREEKLEPELQALLREKFHLSAEALNPVNQLGNAPVDALPETRLTEAQLQELIAIAGEQQVDASIHARASHAYGKYYTELLRLRMKQIPNPPDAVVYPVDAEMVDRIVGFCHQHGIALTPFGASSSVTRGVETVQRGISLDVSRHMNQVLEFNPTNHTVCVQPGIYGPELERYLNRRGFTCGHFPQSFEYSTAGGWVAARGAGQASTGYGKIEDMVVALRVSTPSGVVQTRDYPRMAQGWNLHETFIGSEGTLGVITDITLKIHAYKPENTRMGTYLFRDFESGTKAMRAIMQKGFGKPHLFRISDPEETEIAFKTKGFDGNFADKTLNRLGYKTGKRCLMFVTVEGDAEYTRLVKRKIGKQARKNGALPLGKGPVKKWLKQRFESAYLRDPLMDAGLITDTLETAVTWEHLLKLWKEAHIYLKKRPNTVAMTHISHVYENGANLYFTFISPAEKEAPLKDYQEYHKGLIDTIVANNGSLSHHHGIGRTLTPWLPTQHTDAALKLMQAVKHHLDPKGIMNPGAVVPQKF